MSGFMQKEPLIFLGLLAFVLAAAIAVVFHVTGTPIQGVKEVAMMAISIGTLVLAARGKVSAPSTVAELVDAAEKSGIEKASMRTPKDAVQ